MLRSWPGKQSPVFIMGPTAAGKTDIALELAQRLPGEIISADSMQVYRGMDIGTAKPTSAERSRARFHLVDVVDPDYQYTVSEWISGAEAAMADAASRGVRAIVCGGTGLYFRSMLSGWSLAGTPRDPEVRRLLLEDVAERGSPALHEELREVDPLTADRLHPNDAVRIVRALEVYRVSGRPLSEFSATDKERESQRPGLRIGIRIQRTALYSRINARVDRMVTEGLEAEVRGLLSRGYGPDLKPMQSLGYKEMVAAVTGEITFEAAVDAIKMNTRRYAKRQETWFRADARIDWIDADDLSSAEISDRIIARLQASNEREGTADS